MDVSSSKICESNKRKECSPEIDDEEEKKMDKFYEIIRSFRDHASRLVFNSNIMPKNTESTQGELVEKMVLKKNKKKKIDYKGKGDDKSSNHKDLFFMSPSQTTTSLSSSQTDTTRNSPNSDGRALGVNVISDYKLQRFSGDQVHDDTQGLDLNLSL
ncbi:hypothetical protein FXO38_27933 [Capsicum annuum]|nr:hypothetical protein FXO38_27933 [Capsicum annuum]KAF3631113.1 hypothetical protein FXO37_28156 [Capsicum annuum]